MRVVRLPLEAHHRGYRIEGKKQGEGILLRVTPTQTGLPALQWWRFRTIRGSWAKAVCDVARYIDQTLADMPERKPTPKSPSVETQLKVREIIRLRARLLAELKRLRPLKSDPSKSVSRVSPAATPPAKTDASAEAPLHSLRQKKSSPNL